MVASFCLLHCSSPAQVWKFEKVLTVNVTLLTLYAYWDFFKIVKSFVFQVSTLLVRRKWLADFKIWEFFSVIYSPCLTTYFGQFAVIFMQLSWSQITMYKRKSTRFREFMKGWRWHIFNAGFLSVIACFIHVVELIFFVSNFLFKSLFCSFIVKYMGCNTVIYSIQ